ncbi:MAG: Gfo/Idh/MocA family oxidoreductase [Paludisphaera borealis]|uniref:Gfo/Idh/MocA family protein n=1 Tax=Paludisphaera borealis TaxID=1387353 RepID=UPI00284AA9D9|nr:Gfo/Idh/MocA family oxidoreductase [Paludisphaera borealis]MDR3620970.1 Gfo/Idh/MocA family oxidoreductase [Paludisphaera borealis]
MFVRTGGKRRDFLRVAASSALLAPLSAPAGKALGAEFRSKNERPGLALIGAGGQGKGDAMGASHFGDFVAVCDVDKNHAEAAKEHHRIGKGKAEAYGDYRKVLDRKDVDAVIVGTPDHWHSKITIDAMKAGKDVYCEKPLTLTIDEGKKLCKVAKETGRVLQVGTQQRSDHNKVFLLAVALVRSGRIGKIKKVTAAIGDGPTGGPFAKESVPPELNWDMWLGQAPKVDYIKQRCHSEFRWWYEYSGGKLTDWGAHHVDIGTWALGMENTGPRTIEVVKGELPVEFKNGYPTVADRFNTTTHFLVRATFANGIPLEIRDDTENGVTFVGEGGRIFVTRDRIDLDGGAVSALYSDPVSDSLLRELRKGKPLDGHMENFIKCCGDRGTPVSDVWTHHRALTTCHLANIAIRLGGRKLTWDAEKEQIVGDAEADAMQTRPQRAGYEVTA